MMIFVRNRIGAIVLVIVDAFVVATPCMVGNRACARVKMYASNASTSLRSLAVARACADAIARRGRECAVVAEVVTD